MQIQPTCVFLYTAASKKAYLNFLSVVLNFSYATVISNITSNANCQIWHLQINTIYERT